MSNDKTVSLPVSTSREPEGFEQRCLNYLVELEGWILGLKGSEFFYSKLRSLENEVFALEAESMQEGSHTLFTEFNKIRNILSMVHLRSIVLEGSITMEIISAKERIKEVVLCRCEGQNNVRW